MKPIIYTLTFERSTKNTHRFIQTEGVAQGEKPMVVYVQKKDMGDQPASAIELEIRVK
jgi:hypothetical protein